MTTATAVEHETESADQATETEPTGASYDDINVPVILMVGAISAIVTVATIFFVQGLCYQWQNSYIRERSYDTVNMSVRKVVDEQKELLKGEQEGIKSIDDSITEVIQKFGKK